MKRLTSHPGSIAYTPSPEFLLNWLPSFSSGRVTLPALKFVDISFKKLNLVKKDQWHDIYIRALVPRTLGYLSFTVARLDDSELLAFIFSKCPGLTRLRFKFNQILNWDPWTLISKCGVPQSIEDLEIKTYSLNCNVFLWLSSMPRLKKLKLRSQMSYSVFDYFEDFPPANYHGSFETLKHIDIFISKSSMLQRILQTPLVTHLTHVRVATLGQVLNSQKFRVFCATLVKCSPGISSFTFYEQNPTHPRYHALRSSAISLGLDDIAVLRPLKLQVLRIQARSPVISDEECCILDSIGVMWPNLEELRLGKTLIKLEDLLQVSTYLPKIRCLGICIPVTKTTPELWSSALRDYAQPPDGFRPGSSLIIGFPEIDFKKKLYELEYNDFKTLARCGMVVLPAVFFSNRGFQDAPRPLVKSVH